MSTFTATLSGEPLVIVDNTVNALGGTFQSNLQGIVPNAEATAAELLVRDDLEMYTLGFMDAFEKMQLGVNNKGSSSTTHGIENGLANEAGAIFSTPLKFMKHGESATGILEQLPGGSVYDVYYPDYLKAGVNSLITAGKTVKFHQLFIGGEKDSNLLVDVNAFPARLATLISHYRTILGAALPIIFVKIFELDARDISINAALQAAADADPLIGIVQSQARATIDNLHFDYTSQKLNATDVLALMQTLPPLVITELLT